MKPTIDELKGSFELSRTAFEPSLKELERVWRYFNNEYYTAEQCKLLAEARLPKETFNIVKLFTRQLSGLYSTMYNTVKLSPRHPDVVQQTALLNDIIRYIDNANHTEAINEQLRLDMILSGVAICEVKAVPTEKVDMFGRVEFDIVKTPIPITEIALDPMSIKHDYSDARFIHRFRWVTEESMIKMFGKRRLQDLNALTQTVANESVEEPLDPYTSYKRYDNYLVVHSYYKKDGDIYSCWWTDDKLITRKKVTTKTGRFPYEVVRLNVNSDPSYYGIFHDVLGSIDAIHQSLIQIQMHVNSNKVIVRKGAVEDKDWNEFKSAIVRVNAILELDNPEDIKIINMDRDIAQQYLIVDRAFNRIQSVLGINDSFLGQAYASDSGRKVKLQQNQTLMSLRYLDLRFNLLYTLIGENVLELIKEYFTSYRIFKIADHELGEKWIEINKPLIDPISNQVLLEPLYHPQTGLPIKDKNGNIIIEPLNNHYTDIKFADYDFEIIATMYNDDDEKNQLMLETMLSGNVGLALQQYNPAGFLRASAMSVESMKSRKSKDIAAILKQTADMIAPQQPNTPHQGVQQLGGQRANSQQLKLPTGGN